MSELKKLREVVKQRKKESEAERKQFEEKVVETEKNVEVLKNKIKKLESTLLQNEVEYRNDLQKNQVSLQLVKLGLRLTLICVSNKRSFSKVWRRKKKKSNFSNPKISPFKILLIVRKALKRIN